MNSCEKPYTLSLASFGSLGCAGLAGSLRLRLLLEPSRGQIERLRLNGLPFAVAFRYRELAAFIACQLPGLPALGYFSDLRCLPVATPLALLGAL